MKLFAISTGSSQVYPDFGFQGHGRNERESRFGLDLQHFHGTGNADDIVLL